jgi:hypothetical protein
MENEKVTKGKIFNYLVETKNLGLDEAQEIRDAFINHMEGYELDFEACSMATFESWFENRKIVEENQINEEQNTEDKKGFSKKTIVIGGLVFTLALGAIFAITRESKYKEGEAIGAVVTPTATPTPEVTIEVTPTPTATPKPTVTPTNEADYLKQIEEAKINAAAWKEYNYMITPEMLESLESKGYSYLCPNDSGYTVFDNNTGMITYISTTDNSTVKMFPTLFPIEEFYYMEYYNYKDIAPITSYGTMKPLKEPLSKEEGINFYDRREWNYAGNNYKTRCTYKNDKVEKVLIIKNDNEVIGYGETYTIDGSASLSGKEEKLGYFYHEELGISTSWVEELITYDNMKGAFLYYNQEKLANAPGMQEASQSEVQDSLPEDGIMFGDLNPEYVKELKIVIEEARKNAQNDIGMTPEEYDQYLEDGYIYLMENDTGYAFYDENEQRIKYYSPYSQFEYSRRETLLEPIYPEDIFEDHEPYLGNTVEEALNTKSQIVFGNNTYSAEYILDESGNKESIVIMKNGTEQIGRVVFYVFPGGYSWPFYIHDELGIKSMKFAEIVALDNMQKTFDHFEKKEPTKRKMLLLG